MRDAEDALVWQGASIRANCPKTLCWALAGEPCFDLRKGHQGLRKNAHPERVTAYRAALAGGDDRG